MIYPSDGIWLLELGISKNIEIMLSEIKHENKLYYDVIFSF